MAAFGHPVRYSFAEYIELEEATASKNEYLDGQIFAMAGGTPEHSALIASVVTQLSNQVREGPCRVHSSDLRIRVLETGLATYPDVTVVCGPWERDPENTQTVVNPSVLVEVTSRSTQVYDRSDKREHYRRIATVDAIVLVAHDRRELEVWSRTEQGWDRHLYRDGDVVNLDRIGAGLDVRALYDDATEPG